jgi:predicted ATPase
MLPFVRLADGQEALMPQPHRFVITGGPGAGKSTLIAALAEAGIRTFEEAGRAILRQQDAIGGPAHAARDPMAYAEAMLQWDMRSYAEAANHPGPAIFDRGVADTMGYLRLIGRRVPAHMEQAARLYRYADPVFVAPPWREIYVHDAERKHGWELAVATHDEVRAVYVELGYRVVDLPLADIDARVRFVLARCRANDFHPPSP